MSRRAQPSAGGDASESTCPSVLWRLGRLAEGPLPLWIWVPVCITAVAFFGPLILWLIYDLHRAFFWFLAPSVAFSSLCFLAAMVLRRGYPSRASFLSECGYAPLFLAASYMILEAWGDDGRRVCCATELLMCFWVAMTLMSLFEHPRVVWRRRDPLGRSSRRLWIGIWCVLLGLIVMLKGL